MFEVNLGLNTNPEGDGATLVPKAYKTTCFQCRNTLMMHRDSLDAWLCHQLWLRYLPMCATAVPADAHFSGYFNIA